MRNEKRIVITGLGVVAPQAAGMEPLWQACLLGRSVIRPITRFDSGKYCCRVAGEVDDFSAAGYVRPKIIKQTDRSTQMGMAACQLAAEDARLQLDKEDPREVGMYFSNSLGGMEFAEPELYSQTFLSPDRVSAYQAIAWFYAAAQGQWSISTGIQGYGKTVVADRAGGLHAIGLGALAIRRGHASVVFAGGFEAPLVPYAFLIYQTSGLLSNWRGDPSLAYRPFHPRRTGLVLAEGSGIVILEELSHALRRNAPIYAELSGFSATCDASHHLHAASDAQQYARCLQNALDSAAMQAAQIDHISADGAATVAGDCTEATAIRQVFGAKDGPTVSAPKSMFGHTLAAAGGIDCALTCRMIREQVALPTAGLDDTSQATDLNLVRTNPLKKNMKAVLCCARGAGGVNASVVLQRYVA
jgi:3-oxoacyl-[acyl-carrier-protein] synthase II